MPIVSFGQKVDSMINLIMERVVDDDDNVNREDLYEELLHFSENPLNINTCQREDLEKLFFLSLSQIENLQYYLYSYGPIYSVYELQLVEGFDAETISFLLPFVFVGEMGEKKGQFVLQKELENGKHEILSRADVTFQQKEGSAVLCIRISNTVSIQVIFLVEYQWKKILENLSIGIIIKDLIFTLLMFSFPICGISSI